MVKGINNKDYEQYAELIHRGNPDFIEVKAYMFVGASTQRLNKENMPFHEEVVEYTKELAKYLPDYGIVSEHIPSRVVMLAKNKFKINEKWHTWIDFSKYHELVNSGKEFTSDDYLKETPKTGLSGKGTKDSQPKRLLKKLRRKKAEKIPIIN